MYPQVAIDDPEFVNTLLNPNTRSAVSASMLIIAGFALTKHLPV